MQGELKTVREFRKRRSEMQQRLEQLQSPLEASAYDHKTSFSNMEHWFFEEKLRLQKEANRRIAELAEKAHAEAVRYMHWRVCVCVCVCVCVYRKRSHCLKGS